MKASDQIDRLSIHLGLKDSILLLLACAAQCFALNIQPLQADWLIPLLWTLSIVLLALLLWQTQRDKRRQQLVNLLLFDAVFLLIELVLLHWLGGILSMAIGLVLLNLFVKIED